ncbi:hypothetical protein DOY81_005307 [Sarcophaga bullata]|nr:hypothetical protein DOY81_005307 [Sarcophaga bullata]
MQNPRPDSHTIYAPRQWDHRRTLQRLTKILKVAKPKTPSKSSTSQTQDNSDVKDVAADHSIKETGEVHSNTNSDEPKTKSAKKVVRRKSVFQEADLGNLQGEPKDKVDTSVNGKVDSSSVDNKDVTKSKTPKKVVRRKSLFQSDNLVTNDEELKQNGETSNNEKNTELKQTSGTNITSQTISFKLNSVKQKNQVKQKTPKKVLTPKSVLANDSVITERNGIQPTKFKKIADDEITPVKTTNTTKRKRISNVNGIASSDKNLKPNVLETTPVKRNKTASISAFEESPMDLTIDERDLTETNESSFIKDLDKILNCVICGKGFSQKGSLREHIESSHMGEKLKQCSHCSTEFRSQQKYEAHVFSEKCKNTKHLCQYPNCNKRFKTVHKMELHMQEKHSSSKLESEDE